MKFKSHLVILLSFILFSCIKERTFYYDNGHIAKSFQYNRHGEFHGFSREYDSSGTLIFDGEYKWSDKHGTSKWYYSNGMLQTHAKYENGKLEGIVKNYDTLGNLYLEREFKNDLLQNYKEIDSTGKVYFEAIYKNDTILSYRFFDETGKVVDGLNYLSESKLPSLNDFEIKTSCLTDTIKIGDTTKVDIRHELLTSFQIQPIFTNGKTWRIRSDSFNYCYIPKRIGYSDMVVVIDINDSTKKTIGRKRFTIIE